MKSLRVTRWIVKVVASLLHFYDWHLKLVQTLNFWWQNFTEWRISLKCHQPRWLCIFSRRYVSRTNLFLSVSHHLHSINGIYFFAVNVCPFINSWSKLCSKMSELIIQSTRINWDSFDLRFPIIWSCCFPISW